VTDSKPTIVGAALAAGHDGQAEVAIDVRYPTGAVRTAVYSYEAIGAALDAAGVVALHELIGHPWTILLADNRRPTVEPEGTTCSI
jgi:hypothetical protein